MDQRRAADGCAKGGNLAAVLAGLGNKPMEFSLYRLYLVAELLVIGEVIEARLPLKRDQLANSAADSVGPAFMLNPESDCAALGGDMLGIGYNLGNIFQLTKHNLPVARRRTSIQVSCVR